MCYCSGNTESLGADIEANEAAIAQLEADIKAKTARKEQLDQELVDHKKDRVEAKEAIAKATAIREKENETFNKESGDQKAYIDALNKAIPAIEKGMGASLIQAPRAVESLKRALAQVSSVTSSEKETVLSFLSNKSPYGDYAPASGEIVGILKQMKDDINKDLGGIVEVEEAAQKAFDELVAAKTGEIKAAGAAIEKKSVRSGELAVEITEDKNAKANAERERGANAEFQANLKKDCKTKTAEWEERTKTRNEELLAISEAIKVLNDDDALEVFKNTLPSPNAPATFFLQYSPSKKAEAFAWLQSAASVSDDRHSQLSLLASMLKAGKISFHKVLKMIDDMIAHLAAEQKTDDKEREWCNTEFENADDKKKDLQNSIQDLTSEIDANESDISTLTEEISALKNKISELDAAVAAATKQRKEEHAEFVAATAEQTAAKQLIEKAKNRLNKFYNPAQYKPPPPREMTEEERIYSNFGGEVPTEPPQLIAGTNIAVNLLQLSAKPEPAPGTWAAGGYKNKGQKSGGVMALMDMLTKDLDTQLAEGKKDEDFAQSSYEELMADSANTRSTDSKSLANKEAAKANTGSRLSDDSGARRARSEELQGTNEYISKLHGQCDFLINNFAFRKEARAKESQALVNAKAVLSGADYA
jgi:chromosome segregation ATPase